MVGRLDFARSLVVSLGALLAVSGCATTGLFAPFAGRAKFDKATPSNPAVRCLCVWQTAEGYGPDGKPSRGVAGQVFFFNRTSVTPVTVDGDVRIFLFDDQGTADERTRPIHQFDIEPAVWQSQLVSTQFGPAYQLFVPYTRQGRHQAELALRVRLTPLNGPVVFSDLASIELPGYDASKLASKTSPELSGARPERASTDGPILAAQIEESFLKTFSEREGRVAPNPHRTASRSTLALERTQSANGLTTTIATIRPEESHHRAIVPPSQPDSARHGASGSEFQIADNEQPDEECESAVPLRRTLRRATRPPSQVEVEQP